MLKSKPCGKGKSKLKQFFFQLLSGALKTAIHIAFCREEKKSEVSKAYNELHEQEIFYFVPAFYCSVRTHDFFVVAVSGGKVLIQLS
jgi:hypothetical protein